MQMPHFYIDENVSLLCEGLDTLYELRHLVLAYNGFLPHHLAQIAETLAESRSLELISLDLSFNQLQLIRTTIPSAGELG